MGTSYLFKFWFDSYMSVTFFPFVQGQNDQKIKKTKKSRTL